MSSATIEYLRNLPPFKELSEQNFAAIEGSLSDIEFPENILIFRQGEQGNCLYIIKKGTVRVLIKSPETNENMEIARLQDGDYFGEMALITGESRSASIETVTPVTLLRMGKTGFSLLLNENPKIALALSHMLIKRLKNTNYQLLESEKHYHQMISPSGKLEAISFAELLRSCEQNSLTGQLKLESKDQQAILTFDKGNVQSIDLGGLNDAEAMDQLMQWNSGNFVIEPTLFAIEEDMPPSEGDNKKGMKTKEKNEDVNIKTVLEKFLISVFARLVGVVGSQALKEINQQTHKQLDPFFPFLNTVNIEIAIEPVVSFSTSEKWDEKKTLAIAVFLQLVLKACSSLVVGMSFLDAASLAGEHRADLEKISFFAFMEHANEFNV